MVQRKSGESVSDWHERLANEALEIAIALKSSEDGMAMPEQEHLVKQYRGEEPERFFKKYHKEIELAWKLRNNEL